MAKTEFTLTEQQYKAIAGAMELYYDLCGTFSGRIRNEVLAKLDEVSVARLDKFTESFSKRRSDDPQFDNGINNIVLKFQFIMRKTKHIITGDTSYITRLNLEDAKVLPEFMEYLYNYSCIVVSILEVPVNELIGLYAEADANIKVLFGEFGVKIKTKMKFDKNRAYWIHLYNKSRNCVETYDTIKDSLIIKE